MYKFGKASKEILEQIDPQLQKVMYRALELSKIDFGIPATGGKRTKGQQHKLFIEGKSKADGEYKRSKHQDGKAVDVFAYVNGKATWESFYMYQIACAVLQAACELGVNVKWGGSWVSFIDLPHFELTNG